MQSKNITDGIYATNIAYISAFLYTSILNFVTVAIILAGAARNKH